MRTTPVRKTLRRDLNLDRAVFLRDHWQREPLLIKQALPNFDSPLSPDDLAYLACQPDALARLIQGKGKRFALEIGPFAEDRFTSLGARDWTLLVQDVDKFDPDVRALLTHFDFLPRWRIEDIMVSYAVTGGSVGAHVDQYDVFLLQAKGSRRWQIDTRAAARKPENQRYLAKQSLRLLERFEANESIDLHAGDMLYLPPGVPHHGVSLSDDCMTFSIGMRAPSHAELIEAYALDRAQRIPERLRFRDAAQLDRDAHSLLASELHAVSDMLFSKPSDAELELWLCRYFTRYRSLAYDENIARRKLARVQTQWQSQLPVLTVLHPSTRAMRCLHRKSWVIGGLECSLTAALGKKFVNHGLTHADLPHLSATALADVQKLIAAGLAICS